PVREAQDVRQPGVVEGTRRPRREGARRGRGGHEDSSWTGHGSRYWYGSARRSLLEMSRQSPSHSSRNRWLRSMSATATRGPASMMTDANTDPMGLTTSLA